MTKIFIDGSQGTTGLKIFERFKNRSDIELLKIDSDKRKDLAERARLINESDITFLCLPDAASIEAVSLVTNDDAKIIDTSTAHRTEDGWAYGFPELDASFEEKIKTYNRIAVPGCYASGFNSIVYPLVKHGIIAADYPVTCYAMSGYTGAGKKGIAQYEDNNRDDELDSPRQYALTQQHKHLKEMNAISGLERVPFFAPHICDYPCGMVVSVPLFADLMKTRVSKGELQQIFAEHYAGKEFVKVRECGYNENMIGSNNFAGRDDMEIEINGNDDRILVTSRFDNLGKGASGAAIECMNIALGLDAKTGLNLGD
ncbi:MAG: N-acetyl-gamma-glutamyl-phosphate reductase [Ruminococcaceae bacterium]|nr:N-acetyl-gamma-glutamyl-phosphate reductase [Oscillospiraceae bacterium]